MATAPLTGEELARWNSWKHANDAVVAAVTAEIGAAAGLSWADFAVLSRLVEVGAGSLRQQELADLLGWQRSRLSRQLSRMQERELVVRTVAGQARMLAATADGREALGRARPAHARAVRRALLERVPGPAEQSFWEAVASIGSRDDHYGVSTPDDSEE